jgi:hypothetical protein
MGGDSLVCMHLPRAAIFLTTPYNLFRLLYQCHVAIKPAFVTCFIFTLFTLDHTFTRSRSVTAGQPEDLPY